VKEKRRVTPGSVCGWLLVSLSRGLAFFLGVYAALSLVGVLLGSGYNTNSWWIDLGGLPRLVSLLLQACAAIALLALSFEVPRKLFWRITGAAICGLFAYVALQNALTVYQIAESGLIHLGFPIPFSLFIMVAFVLLALAMLFGHSGVYWRFRITRKGTKRGAQKAATHQSEAHAGEVEKSEVHAGKVEKSEAHNGEAHASEVHSQLEKPSSVHSSSLSSPAYADSPPAYSGDHRATPVIRKRRPPRLATAVIVAFSVVLCGVAFPLGQIFCFGMTDYRNPTDPVDAVVIFGAQVYSNGQLSAPLRNRVDAGIKLYEQGCTPILIMSGGTGWEGVNEAEAMRLYAINRGVPATAILIDTQGNTTELSVANTRSIAQEHGFKRLGAASSFYHLARIKMLYLYEGIDVVTVPASSAGEGPATKYAAMREIPGWWYYWFKNLLR